MAASKEVICHPSYRESMIFENGYTMENVYPEDAMKVAKWGNSLAVRLPASVVSELNIKEGDEVELLPRAERTFEVSLNERRRKALERMRALAVPLPPGYKFDREEANARGPEEPAAGEKPGTAAA
jgi:antitoxin MazE